ncbi:CoA-binding protein, partial [Candidatus Woesearchaeota archaeon]|nr:CoA-binding protein [Candidatus Woesearchaeota archaeon]
MKTGKEHKEEQIPQGKLNTVAIIGASKDRDKFGNKAVRAYKEQGFTVFPVNPKVKTIEGLACFKSVKDITEKVDFMSIYLPPAKSMGIVDEIIEKKPQFLYINPGAENAKFEKKLTENGIEVRKMCSIIAV